jgi:hypothetical protein
MKSLLSRLLALESAQSDTLQIFYVERDEGRTFIAGPDGPINAREGESQDTLIARAYQAWRGRGPVLLAYVEDAHL